MTPTDAETSTQTATPAASRILTATPMATRTSAPTSTYTLVPTGEPTLLHAATAISKETQAPKKPDILSQELWGEMSPEVRQRAIMVDKWFKSVKLEKFTDEEAAKLHYYSVRYLSYLKNSQPDFEQRHPEVDLPNGLFDGMVTKLPRYMTYIVNNTGNGNWSSYRGKYGAPFGVLIDLETLNRPEASEQLKYMSVMAMIVKEEVTNEIIDRLVYNKLPDMSSERVDHLAYAGFLVTIEDLQAVGITTAKTQPIIDYDEFIKGLYLDSNKY